MLGAIIGDIIGSIYEWERIKTKDFSLFDPNCDFTDDSVCTAAFFISGSISPYRRPMKVMGTVRQCASHQRRSSIATT